MTLRTVARDTKSVRPNPLTARPCSKEARRISPILSTPIIPISPSQPTEAKGKDADTQRQRGSLLDAKIAPQGVIIASEFTRYLIRDRDGAYGEIFIHRVRSIGIRDRPTSPRSPWQNACAERLIGSIRRECLDHIVVFGERHLRHVLLSYMNYYNGTRTHLSLHKDAPISRAAEAA